MITLLCFASLGLLTHLAFVLHRRYGSFLQLGTLFAAQFALNYPIRTLVLAWFGEDALPTYRGLIEDSALFENAWMQLCGTISFVLAYELLDWRFPSPLLLRANRGEMWHDLPQFIAIPYALSLAAKAYRIATGNYVSFVLPQNIDMRFAFLVDSLQMFGFVGLSAVWAMLFVRRRLSSSEWTLFIAINLLEFSYQMIQGSKTYLLLPIFIVALAWHFAKRRLPDVRIAGLTVLALLLVFPFVTSYRRTFTEYHANAVPRIEKLRAGEIFEDSYQHASERDTTLYKDAMKISSRFAGTDELYNISILVPFVLPYKVGSDFQAVLLTLIPRAIWTDKPSMAIGGEYGEAIGARTSITPFPLGELYWNLGWLGILLGMPAWAAVLVGLGRIFDAFCRRASAKWFVVAVFLGEAYWATTSEGTLPMLLASTIKKLAVYFLLYKVGQACATLAQQRRTIPVGGTSERPSARSTGTLPNLPAPCKVAQR
ncbi:MAG: hypothetical protein FD180_1848 [Planctomycetota bacterium]|nr:MAG: hypothetical protein FD180_1848 [Planctomycetota bacterium]